MKEENDSTQQQLGAVSGEGPAEAADEPKAAADAKPRRRARRAASRPAGPPAAVFSEAPADEPAAPEVNVDVSAVAAVFQAPDAPADKVKPKGRAAKSTSGAGTKTPKKAVKKPASSVEQDSPSDAVAGEPDGQDPDEETSPVAEDGESQASSPKRRRRRGGRGRGRKSDNDQGDNGSQQASEETPDDAQAPEAGVTESAEGEQDADSAAAEADGTGAGTGSKRRRRRRRRGAGESAAASDGDEVTAVKGSTRLEAKKQRRREGRAARGMRAPILTEAEFLARREAVQRSMVVRQRDALTQIAVLEDEVLVEHYVSSAETSSIIGNVYLGRVQNVLPSMEAAFVDIGRGRNAVLYAGEVNWDAAGLEGQPKRIELALKSGDAVMVQATKDPIGQKGARLTSQISLPGRFLVYVPEGGMTGISRKLPDRERARLKRILKAVLPDDAGVIVRTAAEGATEEQLRADVERLAAQWEQIRSTAESAQAPALLRSEPDLAIKVARDIFTEDFAEMVVSGDEAYQEVHDYVETAAPDLGARVRKWTDAEDVFAAHRIDEQLTKALDRKVWLPSGGSLVIDRTEAMTVIDVNTGKFVGKGGNLEETVTRNNLEAAEEIVRQLRLRDVGGIIVVDFIDMVLESNRELVLRRLVECLSRDRTKHQVAEVTSLGLVQMTRKRIGQGLLETFSVACDTCGGRGVKVQTEPVAAGSTKSSRPRRQKITGAIPGAPLKSKGDESQEATDAGEAPEASKDASEAPEASKDATGPASAPDAAEAKDEAEVVVDLVAEAAPDLAAAERGVE